jgi:hypothetical protein
MLSTTIAIPCPPPMHAVASPHFFLGHQIIMLRRSPLIAKVRVDARIEMWFPEQDNGRKGSINGLRDS